MDGGDHSDQPQLGLKIKLEAHEIARTRLDSEVKQAEPEPSPQLGGLTSQAYAGSQAARWLGHSPAQVAMPQPIRQ